MILQSQLRRTARMNQVFEMVQRADVDQGGEEHRAENISVQQTHPSTI